VTGLALHTGATSLKLLTTSKAAQEQGANTPLIPTQEWVPAHFGGGEPHACALYSTFLTEPLRRC
jgi:hypothetical protein